MRSDRSPTHTDSSAMEIKELSIRISPRAPFSELPTQLNSESAQTGTPLQIPFSSSHKNRKSVRFKREDENETFILPSSPLLLPTSPKVTNDITYSGQGTFTYPLPSCYTIPQVQVKREAEIDRAARLQYHKQDPVQKQIGKLREVLWQELARERTDEEEVKELLAELRTLDQQRIQSNKLLVREEIQKWNDNVAREVELQKQLLEKEKEEAERKRVAMMEARRITKVPKPVNADEVANKKAETLRKAAETRRIRKEETDQKKREIVENSEQEPEDKEPLRRGKRIRKATEKAINT